MNARVADAKSHAAPEAAPAVARPTLSAARGLTLHRKCACGGDAGHGATCTGCASKNPPLQRRGNGGAGGPSGDIPSSVHETLSQPGRPLDTGTRSLMESRFGEDFSSVRVHDDSGAAQSARDVHAHAYTVGESIVFAPGQYQPHSEAGQHLIAHELAHTVQQKGLQRSGVSNLADQGPEYRRLEAEADRAADFAMRGGGTFGHGLNAASHPTLSRAAAAASGDKATGTEVEIDVSTSQLGQHKHKIKAVGGYEKSGTLQAFTVDPMLVPKSKGPNAVARYNEVAGGALAVTLTMYGKKVGETALWQNRPKPENLRNRWLQAVGWSATNASANWQALGGDKEFPKCGGKICQMDHIVELQLHGNNTNENMQALDQKQNGDSGSALRAHVSAIASKIQDTKDLTDGTAKELQLRFTKVEFAPTEGFADFEVIDQGANTCLGVEFRARNPTHPSAAAMSTNVKREAPVAGTEEMKISAGGLPTALQVPQGFVKNKSSPDVVLDSDAANKSASTLIPGLILVTLKRDPMVIAAKVDAAPTRVPLTLSRNEAAIELIVAPVPTDGVHKLSIKPKSRPNIEFTYPYLSPGSITSVEMRKDGSGVDWTGEIRSRVPFLPKPLLVKYKDEQLSLGVALNEKTLGKTLPGFKVTKAGIDLILSPNLSANGSIEYLIGSVSRPVATGSVEVKGDSSGLTAGGKLAFKIPGVDFGVDVTYKDEAWSASATIAFSQIKIPYVTGGSLTFAIDNAGLHASGSLDVTLPRDLGTASLEIKSTAQGFYYAARGKMKVPGLHEVTVWGSHDGRTLSLNAANIGFKWKGFDGTIEKVTYTQVGDGTGTITGTGKVTLTRGAASGSITVTLHDDGKFSGEGEVNYPLTIKGKKIDAKAKVIVDKDQNVHVEGSLKLATPIVLFEKSSNDKEIFSFEKTFPVPSLSIGPLGLQAVILAGVSAGYYFGPGQLKNVSIEAAFNPLAEKIDPSLKFHCDLDIPAGVNLTAKIGGGLRLEAGIGRVTGTITISAKLGLDMSVNSPLDVTYTNEVFAVNAKPGIDAALKLGLSLDAYAKAEIGISPISAYVDNTWNLGRRDVTLGQFSLHAPVGYSSDTGFKIPSVDELEWGPTPTIDVPSLVDQLVHGSDASKTEKPA